ncbi:hypothetical protein ACFLZN_02590, partial [Nanoarchaeota archaeon]
SITWINNVNAVDQNFDSHISMGSGYVSMNASALDSSLNSTVQVNVSVASCENWQVYYASQPVDNITHLQSVGSVIGSGHDDQGTCSDPCQSVTCVNNRLVIEMSHLDGVGGEGANAIPEFSTYALLLALALTIGGFVVLRKRK